MFRKVSLALATLVLAAFAPSPSAAQAAEIPEGMRVDSAPRQKLAGPRVGFTAFTGTVAEGRRALGKSAVMTQFGWQFETQVVATSAGHQALLEVVPLIGGVEQSEFNLSVAGLAGFRLPNGVEFGVGPNLSLASETLDATSSMVTAFGVTLPFGNIRIPANIAIAFAEGGPRITSLIGWIFG